MVFNQKEINQKLLRELFPNERKNIIAAQFDPWPMSEERIILENTTDLVKGVLDLKPDFIIVAGSEVPSVEPIFKTTNTISEYNSAKIPVLIGPNHPSLMSPSAYERLFITEQKAKNLLVYQVYNSRQWDLYQGWNILWEEIWHQERSKSPPWDNSILMPYMVLNPESKIGGRIEAIKLEKNAPTYLSKLAAQQLGCVYLEGSGAQVPTTLIESVGREFIDSALADSYLTIGGGLTDYTGTSERVKSGPPIIKKIFVAGNVLYEHDGIEKFKEVVKAVKEV